MKKGKLLRALQICSSCLSLVNFKTYNKLSLYIQKGPLSFVNVVYPCCEYYLKILIFFKADNHAASWTKSYEMKTGADYYLLRSFQQLFIFRFALLIWKIEKNEKN